MKKPEPFKVKIISAVDMRPIIQGYGWAEDQLSNGELRLRPIRGTGSWYVDKVGEVFDVLPFSKRYVRLLNNVGCGFYFISIKDCKNI